MRRRSRATAATEAGIAPTRRNTRQPSHADNGSPTSHSGNQPNAAVFNCANGSSKENEAPASQACNSQRSMTACEDGEVCMARLLM